MNPQGDWLVCDADGCTLTLQVQPGARRTELAGLHGALPKVRLAAAPVEGQANDCLCTFLAELLAVPRRTLTLVGGERARRKRVRIASAEPLRLAERMRTLIDPGRAGEARQSGPPQGGPGTRR